MPRDLPPQRCPVAVDWGREAIDCDLDAGHDGDHLIVGDGHTYPMAPDYLANELTYEFRWREKTDAP